MMARTLGLVLLVALATDAAQADVVLVKKGRGVRVLGLDKKIDDVEVTPDNWRIFLPQSEGVILEINYDTIVFKNTAKTRKVETFKIGDVVEYALDPVKRSEALDAGFGAFSRSDLAGAIREFQAVLGEEEARPVDKAEANFNIGYAYAAFGRLPLAEKHFAAWNGGKSKFTPDAYRLLAEIYTGKRKYAEARAAYKKIIDLPDLPMDAKLSGEAGLIKVDIAERKYREAEAAAKAVISKAARGEQLNNARALAMGLLAEAILASQAEARYPEAEKSLKDALELANLTNTNKAYLNATLGRALYAQRKLEEARFPLMRVVTLFPEERGYVANSLLDAGNCFIDLAGQAKNEGNEKLHDDLLIKGMLLISECGVRHKGTAAARQASGVWRRNRAEYEAAKKRQGK